MWHSGSRFDSLGLIVGLDPGGLSQPEGFRASLQPGAGPGAGAALPGGGEGCGSGPGALLRPQTLFSQPEPHLPSSTAGPRLRTVPEPGVCSLQCQGCVRTQRCPGGCWPSCGTEVLPAVVQPGTVRMVEVCGG